ncbi:MAG: hypothetical protein EOP59_19425 [Sphingomonadales bacterium]|nr:MAG: hypothetical protein EOP59_19425 [Sphingomonadales bacterium]
MSWLRTELSLAVVPFSFAIIGSAAAAAAIMFLAFILIPPVAIFAGVLAFLAATPVAFAHVLLVGLPIHLLMRRTGGDVRWYNAVPLGFAVGTLAGAFGWTGLIGWMADPEPYASATWQDLVRITLFGVSGAAGGLMFVRKFRDDEAFL